MKSTIALHTTEKPTSWIKATGKSIAQYIDSLIVRYYYKGERLRPEVWEEIEQSRRDFANGRKNFSPEFTDIDSAFDWLDSR